MKKKPELTQAQLFLDDCWIEEAQFISRQWHQPRRFPDPVLTCEHPWERGALAMYGTVLHWRGKFRMWYGAYTDQPLRRVHYAESDDGVVWEKPQLGVCECMGNKKNNVVVDALHPRYIDNITVIDDPDDAEWPLKALFWEATPRDWAQEHGAARGWGIYAARSKDGIHWDRSPGLVLPKWIDRFNACSAKLDGKYVLWGRGRSLERGMLRNGRSVWRTESKDLRRWTKEELVLERDPEDPLNMEYYSLVAFPYESLTLGGLERMYMSPDRMDTELVWSHDGGRKWERAAKRPAFLTPSPERRWDDTWVNLPTNAPIRHGNRLWFYYSGRSGAHGSPYPSNHGAIGLAFLRIDGFASLQAAEREGRVVTRPMLWPSGDLYVNADPRRNLAAHPAFCSGEVRVEVRDASNRPLRGFTWQDCQPIVTNTVFAADSCAAVAWKDGKTARLLAGRQIRLAFQLRDAHLYSFRAALPRKATAAPAVQPARRHRRRPN